MSESHSEPQQGPGNPPTPTPGGPDDEERGRGAKTALIVYLSLLGVLLLGLLAFLGLFLHAIATSRDWFEF